MALRSKTSPSIVLTGSTITLLEMGQKNSAGIIARARAISAAAAGAKAAKAGAAATGAAATGAAATGTAAVDADATGAAARGAMAASLRGVTGGGAAEGDDTRAIGDEARERPDGDCMLISDCMRADEQPPPPACRVDKYCEPVGPGVVTAAAGLDIIGESGEAAAAIRASDTA